MGGFVATHHSKEPFRCGLFACYEAFGAELVESVSIHPLTCRCRRVLELTIPVSASTCRDRVSTAMTCVDLSFHGQYFLQFAVDTSSQE